MKFIPVNSARKLQIDQPVLIQYGKANDNSPTAEIGWGRMVKEEKTSKGIVRTFEVATFNAAPESTTSVTHVAIP